MKQNKKKFKVKLTGAKKVVFLLIIYSFLCGGSFFSFGNNMSALAKEGNGTKVSKQQQYQRMIEALVEKLNREREKIGLKPLEVDPKLQQMAEYKLQSMARDGYFAHVSPSGQTAWDIFDRFGYNYSFAGENLATNFVDADNLHRAWMRSPEHRKNILFPQYTKVGLAIGETRTGALLAVEYFAKPITQEELQDLSQIDRNHSGLIKETKTELGAGAFGSTPREVVELVREKESDRLIGLNNLVLLILELVALILVTGVWALEKEDELFLERVKNESCAL